MKEVLDRLKKLGAIIITFVMALGLIIPANAMESYADTVYIQTGLLSECVSLKGYDSRGRLIINNAKENTLSAPDGNTVYCSDLQTLMKAGTKNIADYGEYTGMPQWQITKIALGIDYIRKNSSYNLGITKMLEQVYLWTVGESYVNAPAKNMTYGVANISPSVVNDWIKLASNYAEANKNAYKGKATAYYQTNHQLLVSFKLEKNEGILKLTKSVKNNMALTDLCKEQYSLAGAIYWVYTDYSSCLKGEDSNYVGRFLTDADGNANKLSLAAGRYYIKEVKAPSGYKLDKQIHQVDVTAGKTAYFTSADEPLFDPLTLKVQKKAADDVDKNLKLEGAEYTVKYYREYLTEGQTKNATPFRTWVFATDKTGIIKLADKWKIGGDKLFKDEDGSPVGLYGTYTFEETKAPKGFAKTDGIISIQQVKDGRQTDAVEVMKDIETTEEEQKVNLHIKKKDSESGKYKAQGYGSFRGAKYDIFRYDPLSSADEKVGTIETDENGEGSLTGLKAGLYRIKEVFAPIGYLIDETVYEIKARIKEINTAFFDYHTDSSETPTTTLIAKTSIDGLGEKIIIEGATMQLKSLDGKVIEEWITTKEAKIFKALGIGKYILHEEKAPEGYIKSERDIEIEVKSVKAAQNFEFFNEPVPEIKTTANFDTGVKESEAKKQVTVIDTVNYSKVIAGKEYTVKGRLVNKNNPDKVIARGETKFTAEKSNGTIDMKFTFDASNLEDMTLVVFEDLYKDGKLLTSHADLTDKKQTVKFPKFGTKATDIKDGEKDLNSGEKETIVDTVSYSSLIIGKEYTVTGILMDKDTGKPILDNGKEVKASKTFVAKKTNGTVEVEFRFNASSLKGKTIVAFEDLYSEKVKIGSHADITDEAQSIYIPEISTTAKNKLDDSKLSLAINDITIVDTVKYKNLMINNEYTIRGKLYDKETCKPLLINGKEISCEKSFIAQKSDGEIKLEFRFDGSRLAGKNVVVFEELFRKSKHIASHNNINDKGQTVKIVNPEIKTAAHVNGHKSAIKSSKTKIIDTISYRDLIPGIKYNMRGTLIDANTGKPIMIEDKCIIAEKEFVAEASEGVVTVEFYFDSNKVKSNKIVVFEKLYQNNFIISKHEDLSSKSQTIELLDVPRTGDNTPLEYEFAALVLAGISLYGIKKYSRYES